MRSLAEMKADLARLEQQEELLRTKMAHAGKQVKVGLWLIGGGVTLIPLYGAGVIMLAAGILYAFVSNERKSRYQYSLAAIRERINSLADSMA